MQGAGTVPRAGGASPDWPHAPGSTYLIWGMITLCALAPGCAYRRLEISTVKQAQTVVELEYQQILNNLAMFCLNPSALPSLTTLKTGATQVGDSGTLGFLGVTGNKGTFWQQPDDRRDSYDCRPVGLVARDRRQ
jgi:hypothetical protein